jgi:hypothetical protein
MRDVHVRSHVLVVYFWELKIPTLVINADFEATLIRPLLAQQCHLWAIAMFVFGEFQTSILRGEKPPRGALRQTELSRFLSCASPP